MLEQVSNDFSCASLGVRSLRNMYQASYSRLSEFHTVPVPNVNPTHDKYIKAESPVVSVNILS